MAKKQAIGRTGQAGRFVTLRSGRAIFIPKGKRSKWADVRDKVKAKKGAEVREVPMTGGRVARIPERYSWAKGVSEEARRGESVGAGRAGATLDDLHGMNAKQVAGHLKRRGWKGLTGARGNWKTESVDLGGGREAYLAIAEDKMFAMAGYTGTALEDIGSFDAVPTPDEVKDLAGRW